MNCQGSVELINRRTDRDLDEAERAQLDAHLARCPACRALDRRMGALCDAFATLRRASDALLQGRDTTDRRARQRFLRIRGWRAVGALAAAACVAFVVLVSSVIRPAPAPPSRPEEPIVASVSSPPPVPLVKLIGESKKKYLAAEVASGVENVRLVYVFPVAAQTSGNTTQPAPRM